MTCQERKAFRQEVIKMAEEITWDEATKNGAFVTLEEDVVKKLTVTNWKFKRKDKDAKVAAGEIEFISEVITEDGETTPAVVWDGDKLSDGKLFTTTSKRLKEKLRPIFEGKAQDAKISLSILRVGKQFNTQYSCKSEGE